MICLHTFQSSTVLAPRQRMAAPMASLRPFRMMKKWQRRRIISQRLEECRVCLLPAQEAFYVVEFHYFRDRSEVANEEVQAQASDSPEAVTQSSMAALFNEELVAHVRGWSAEHFEVQASIALFVF